MIVASAVSFFIVHNWPWLILLALFLFPRLFMLIFGWTGVLGIPLNPLTVVGWFLAPRITLATIAYMVYGATNPVLVGFALLLAVLGDLGEKTFVKHKKS